MKATTTNQITEGVIWKQLLLFFFPILLGTLFQQLYNTADTLIVGRYVGTSALAAVGGSTGQIVNLIVLFFVGLSSGSTVIMARYYGARHARHLNDTLHTSIALSIVGGIVFGVLGIVFAPFMLKLMNTPADIIETSTTYLRIYFSGLVFLFIYNVGSGILRAVGDSKRPLYFLIISCFINIFLDILFVVVFKMGVAGAGFATITAQAISATLVLIALKKSGDIYHLQFRRIRFHKLLLLSIITIGLPAGLQSLMFSLSNIIIQTAMNSLGTTTVAAHTAFAKIDSLYWMVSGAFSVSILTFIGQNYGAQKYDRMKKSIKVCLLMDIIVSLCMSGIMILGGSFLLRLFTKDAAVIEIGVRIIHMICPSYILFVFIEILSSSLRGMGNVLVPMFMTCGGVCVLRVIWILFVIPDSLTITNILLSYPISWGSTALLFIVYFYFFQKKFFREHQEEKSI